MIVALVYGLYSCILAGDDMKAETKAMLFEQGGKIASDLFRAFLTRPAKSSIMLSPEKPKQTAVTETKPVITETPAETHRIPIQPTKSDEEELSYRWECLPTETLLYGKESIHRINRLQGVNNGLKYGVLTHSGSYHNPTGWMSRDYDGRMMNIHFWYTNIPLIITPNHPILLAKDIRTPQDISWRDNGGIDEDKIDWSESGEITNRDFIAFPRITDTHDMEIISPLLAELCGWYVPEGCVDSESGAITISLGQHEFEKIYRVKHIVTQLLGREPRVDNGGSATRITFSCDPLATLLSKQFGSCSHNKRIPNWFMYLPHDKQYAFLKPMILGDGNIGEYMAQYTTSSDTLAYQMRVLLFRLGILHGVMKRTPRDGQIDGRIIHATTDAYNIQISGDALRTFMRGVGLQHNGGKSTSGNFGWISPNYAFIPVKTITDEPFSGKVYNVAVEHDESYLTIHGSLHNCTMKHLGGASILLREAYERAVDGGVGDGTAEKIMEALNEHSGMEADVEKMLGMPDAQAQAERILGGVKAFRNAAWKAKLPTGGGTVQDIADARLWNNILYQEAYNSAKKQPGTECILEGAKE